MRPPRAAFALALAVGACGAPSPAARDTAAPAAAPVTTPSPADSLRLTLDVPREVASGAAVPMTLRIESVAPRPLDLYLRGRDVTFDVMVTDAGGREVWRRLEGEVVQAIALLRPIRPGETIERRAVWDGRTREGGPAPPGEYTVRALLLTEAPEPLAAPAVPMRILER